MRALGVLVALGLGIVGGEPARCGWVIALVAVALLVAGALRWRRPLWLVAGTLGLLRVAWALASAPPPPSLDAWRVVVWPEPAGEDCQLQLDDGLLLVGPLALCDALLPGDAVKVPRAPRDGDGSALPGEPSELDRLAWRGAARRLRVLRAAEIVKQVDHASSWRRPLAAWRRAARRHFDATLPDDEAGLIRALVLGERQAVAPVDEGRLTRLGALHVVSVSGLHLGLVVVVLLLAGRGVVRRVPWLLLRWPLAAWAALLAAPGIVGYTVASGLASPTLRAMLAALLLGLAPFVRRHAEPLTSLAIAALLLLLDEPSRLYDVSLQLSVVATLGLLWASHRARAPLRLLDSPVRRWLRTALWLSFGSTVFTLPLCGWHFGELVWTAPLGNLLVVPLFELVLLPLGLVITLLTALPAVAPIVKLLVYFDGALRETTIFARAFVEVAAGAMPGPWIAGALGATILAALAIGASYRRIVWLPLAIAVAIVTWPRGPRLAATFLSVGHGDAALVELPGGARLLVDGGGSLEPALDPGRRVLLPFLRRRGIDRIDRIVISHPHLDHVGGLVAVAEHLAIGEIALAVGDEPHLPALLRLLAVAKERDIPVRAPHAEALGATVLTPLHPVDDRGTIAVDEVRTTNDNSVVLRVAWQRASILFPGDLEAEGEAELGDRHPELRTTLLKIPHHGSSTSSSERLLTAVQPQLAILSGGRHNRFGLPKPSVLERYRQHGIPIRRTDLEGALRVELDRDGAIQVRRVR